MQNLLQDLTKIYSKKDIKYPHLKSITLAQWILESGWGKSNLAIQHHNFAGMKWRKEMSAFAREVIYLAHDGQSSYCHFESLSQFIDGYWRFLDRTPYKGWEQHTQNGRSFITFIGKIWAEDPRYVNKVISLEREAKEMLSDCESHSVCDEKCCEESNDLEMIGKPKIDRSEFTTHKSYRNGQKITHIVIHYTTSRNMEGTISWFKNAPQGRRVSAHYIIGQDGIIVQMVNDTDSAWHAGSADMNRRSIGIEHVAKVGDKITVQQSQSSIKLIKWLMQQYGILKANIIPHSQLKKTSCCGDLFIDFGGGIHTSPENNKAAIDKWLTQHGI
jgi:hypothetical protein